MGSSSTKLDPVIIPLIHGESVLDVGCGYGRWGFLLFSNYWEGLNANRPVVDGVDAYQPSVDFCSKLPVYRKVWKHELPTQLKGKWDVVLASEIIEHIPQKDVAKTLAVLENAARKRVIITTPSFPCPRGGGETHFGFNEYEAHKSYVSASYLRKRGYKVMSIGFGNPQTIYARFVRWLVASRTRANSNKSDSKNSGNSKNKNSSANPDYSVHLSERMRHIALALEPLARLHPYFASFIVAYKDIK